MKILRQRDSWVETHHKLCFWYPDQKAGYSFDCDENGKVQVEKLTEAAKTSYQACLKGQINGMPLDPPFVNTFEQRVVEDAEGLCVCGRVLILSHFTNTCACGRDYSRSGQALAPRSQWGEETGETLAEILSIP